LSETITYAALLSRALEDSETPLEMIGPNRITNLARQNDKRPAYIQYSVPDEWVKNLVGTPEFADAYILIKIPREHFPSSGKEQPVIEPQV